jgi:hypothetical protein
MFLTPQEMEQRYNIHCDILKYNRIKDAIPQEWRKVLQSMKIPPGAISFNETITLNVNKNPKNLAALTNKDIYWILVKNKQAPPNITQSSWNKLTLSKDQWREIFTIPKVIRNTKIKAFQYKTLFNLLPCNLYLNRIKRSDTDRCDMCGILDDIPHYLLECPQVRNFWDSFSRWWSGWNDNDIIINRQNILAGKLGKKQEMLNACILLGKWHIYRNKLNQECIFFYKFLCDLKYYLSIEKTIALRNNKLTNYETIWKKMEDILT